MPRYKYCMVPMCTNTTFKTPDKIFINVPKEQSRRHAWFKAARRDVNKHAPSAESTLYCCEDHFTLQEDMENYIRYKIVGARLQTKKNVVPHIFDCQQRKYMHSLQEQSLTIRKRKVELINDALQSASNKDNGDNVGETQPVATYEPDPTPPPRVPAHPLPTATISAQAVQSRLRGTKSTTPRYEDVSQLVSRFTSTAKVELKCRMCMLESGKKPMIPIFKNQPALKAHLATKIFDITGLMVEEGDWLPDQICQPCNKNIVNCYDFRAMCIRSNEKYRKQIEKQMAKKRKPTIIDTSGAKPRKRQYQPEVVINMEAYKKPRLVKTTETYNKPHQVIVTENPIDVKLEIEEHNIFDTGSHFMSMPTTMYDGQDLEQMSQEAGGDSMDEIVPPPFFTVKVEPEEGESMWNPEVSLNYKPHDDHNTSQLPDTECKIEFVGGGTVDTALVDPLSIPTPEVTVAAAPMTGPQIPMLTVRNQPSAIKMAKFLLAVKPMSTLMSTPPSYVLALSSDPPADSTPVSTFPVNIPAMPNSSVITNVPVPLSTRPDSVDQSILPRNNDVDPLGNVDSGAKESNGDPSGV